MRTRARQIVVIIIIILMLLLHCAFLWVTFCTHQPSPLDLSLLKQETAPEEPISPTQDREGEQNQHNDWANLTGSGAPVIFKNTIPEDDAQVEAPEQPHEQHETEEQEHDSTQETESKDLAFEPLVQENSLISFPEKNSAASPSPVETEKKVLEKPETVQPTITAEPAPPQPKKFSFAQLAQGFSQHMNDQGGDAYTMRGARNGKASAEQIKHANYRNKIFMCLKTAILANRTKAIVRQEGMYRLRINLVISPPGGIHQLVLQDSCGAPTLDMFIMRAIQDAQSSFPPIPAGFNVDTYPMSIMFENVIGIIRYPEQLHWTL